MGYRRWDMGRLGVFSLVGAVVPNRPWTTIRHWPLGLLRTRLRRPGDNGPYRIIVTFFAENKELPKPENMSSYCNMIISIFIT
jgi:hypothetical protein